MSDDEIRKLAAIMFTDMAAIRALRKLLPHLRLKNDVEASPPSL
jgi:hypothetical protein